MANNRRSDELFGYDDFDNQDGLFEDEALDDILDEIAEIKRAIQGELPEDATDSDSLAYDEADKLREEVRFNKTTQKLQNDIRQLNNRISDLQDERGGDSAAQPLLDDALERLIELNEELIKRSKESDRKLNDEIGSIKNQLYKLASVGDMAGTLNAISTNLKNNEEYLVSIGNNIETITGSENPTHGSGTGVSAELLRQIYDIKNLLGNSSPVGEKRNAELLELYELLEKVKFDVGQKNLSVAEKFASVDVLAKRLYETNEYEISPIVETLNAIIKDLCASRLERAAFDTILEYAGTGGIFNIPNSKREAVKVYLERVAALNEGNFENMDDLPEIIALKNSLQDNKNEFECENVYSAVLNTNIALLSEKDHAKQKALRQELKSQLKSLTSLEVGDLVSYPPVNVSKTYRAVKHTEGEGLFAKLNELKNFLLDANIAQSGGVISETANSGLITELNNLKNEICNLNNMDGVSQAILDLKSDCVTIIDKLDERKENGEDDGYYAGGPTLDDIVAQLDRLFDDIKNVEADSENNILSSLEVISEAVAKFSVDRSEAETNAKGDRAKILEDVAFIRSAIESGTAVASVTVEKESLNESTEAVDEELTETVEEGEQAEEEPLLAVATEGGDSSAPSETRTESTEETESPEIDYNKLFGTSQSGNDEINARLDEFERVQSARLDEIEKTQKLILSTLENIANSHANTASVVEASGNDIYAAIGKRLDVIESKLKGDDVLGEIKMLRDQLFAVSMANVSDGDNSSYESYNNLILNEIYSLEDDVAAMSDSMSKGGGADGEKLAEELAALKSELNDALNKNADSDSILSEIQKIKDEYKKRPAPQAKKHQPPKYESKPPVFAQQKKKVTPIVNSKDQSINDILAKIGQTDIVVKND